MFGRIASLFALFGLDLGKMYQSVKALPWFIRSYHDFKSAHGKSEADFAFGKLYPCLDDRVDDSGVARGHYFHGDLLVAQRIFENKPLLHADIGSRLDGFVAHVAAFRCIDVFDIRPLTSDVKNLSFRRMDFTKSISPELLGHYDSASCLHALEHFGLGRYGDDLDRDGHLKGFEAISKLVSAGGRFYLSVPMGPQRIEFNAHRVFSLPFLRQMCGRYYKIEKFSYVDDTGRLFKDVPVDTASADRNYNCSYGLAILEMIKQ